MHVHPHHVQAGHGLNGLANVFLHVLGGRLDGRAVFDHQVNIHGDFLRAQLHLDAAGDVLGVAGEHLGNPAGRAHSGNAFHFVGGDACNDGHHFIGVGDGSGRVLILIQRQGQIILFGGHDRHLLWSVSSRARRCAYPKDSIPDISALDNPARRRRRDRFPGKNTQSQHFPGTARHPRVCPDLQIQPVTIRLIFTDGLSDPPGPFSAEIPIRPGSAYCAA